MVKKIMVSLLGLGAAVSASAQVVCGTDQLHQQLRQADPRITGAEQQLENAIRHGMQHLQLRKLAKTTGSNDTVYYDIPLVIHVVHDFGNEYVSDNVIFDAVRYWNEVFSGSNADTADVIAPFKPYIGNARMRLRLANIDPNGNPTKGITRRHSYYAYNGSDAAKMDVWPNDKYLNIWLVREFSGQFNGVAAYAYYPSSAAYIPHYDGIIGLASTVNQNKTYPHEIGHSMNLAHTWGSTNQPGVACGDDGVDDTPPTMGHMLGGCSAANIYDVTCATGYVKNGIDYPDTTNAQNIMDYTYCDKMFTIGQTERMRLALTSSTAGRNNLITAANLSATGALQPRADLLPIPVFSVEKGQYPTGFSLPERSFFLCPGGNTGFVFKNFSWNDTITAVNWTFTNGGATTTSTSMNTVRQTFHNPGWVSVSLTATGNNNGSATLTNDRAVYVADPNTVSPAGYMQQFGSVASLDKWPAFNYYGNEFKWEWFGGAGMGDQASLRYRSFDSRGYPENRSGNPAGDYDDIFTEGFNLSAYASGALNLNFYTSGATTSNGVQRDTLEIFASSDCGARWELVGRIGGSNLINNSAQNTEFVPTSQAQWRAQTLNIPVANRGDKVFFRLRYKPHNNSNNLYLDNFSISPFNTEVQEVAQAPGAISIFPNPAQGDITIALKAGNDGQVGYTIRDLAGKIVYQHQGSYAPNALVQHQVPGSTFAASGMYLVSVTVANQTFTEKLVIQK